MKYHVFILKNSVSGRYYCGHTDDLERRLREHNDPLRSGVKWTRKIGGPWVLIWSTEIGSRSGVMALERKIKQWSAERYLANILPAESRQRADKGGDSVNKVACPLFLPFQS